MDPMTVLRRRLFDYTSAPWEGETLALKITLIEATENWETLTGGGLPCPVTFDAEDVRKTKELDVTQRRADRTLDWCRNMVCCGPEGWVPAERYEEAMTYSKELKEGTLAMDMSEEERAEITGHWPFTDMDEKEYM